MKKTTVVSTISIPAAVSSTVNPKTETNRVYLLTHYAASASMLVSRKTIVSCENGL